jgi:hypothetical protein
LIEPTPPVTTAFVTIVTMAVTELAIFESAVFQVGGSGSTKAWESVTSGLAASRQPLLA